MNGNGYLAQEASHATVRVVAVRARTPRSARSFTLDLDSDRRPPAQLKSKSEEVIDSFYAASGAYAPINVRCRKDKEYKL